MTLPIILRVNRVERWRPGYADDAPILTTVEVREAGAAFPGGAARPSFGIVANGHTPTRLFLNFFEDVTDLTPGEYLALTIEKITPPTPGAADSSGIPL
jgi:hypothetical protein